MAEDPDQRSWRAIPASRKEETSLMVQFSPEVLRRLARLEDTVRDDKGFAPEILENLQEYSEGRPMLVANAITAIAHVTMETTKRAASTSNVAAKAALSELLDALTSEKARPVQLVKAVSKDR